MLVADRADCTNERDFMNRKPVQGALIDVDGVLHVDGTPIPGTADALNRLRADGVPFRLLTNTTMRTRAALGELLRGFGCDVSDDEIITAASATAAYIKKEYPDIPCHLLVSGNVVDEFAGVQLTDGPDAGVVVIGGAGREFTFDTLNQAFRLLLNGASLVAMHKDHYWRTADGLSLDAGAFITGLELAAGVQSKLVGKPSHEFFNAGFDSLGLPPENVVMVGDSILHDLVPAMELGAIGVLLRTGIFMEADLQKAPADVVLDSFVDVPQYIRNSRAM
jgi:HAD superfamily hydrolase (TIGR01458 family)